MTFDETVASITQAGLEWHRETILRNSLRNSAAVGKTLREVHADRRPCLIVSAGPSLRRQNVLSRLHGFDGCIVSTDSAYLQCLKADILPDWVVTLDPHPTRMVRWFGDPDFAQNSKDDDYFARTAGDFQALADNDADIALVDENPTRLAIASTAPANVVARTSRMDRYWFVPLVDKPVKGSLTRIMAAATGCPALNTGGTVGTAAWAFAHQVLRSPRIAIVGADYAYYDDLPLERTQEWQMLGDAALFPEMEGIGGKCRTSPLYFWYAENFKTLLEAADARITNCSGHGILQGERVDCMDLETWLASSS